MTITVTDIAIVFLALGTLVSLIYISRQVRVTRQQTKGELCYALADYRQRKGNDPRDKIFIERVHKLSKETRRLNNPWRF